MPTAEYVQQAGAVNGLCAAVSGLTEGQDAALPVAIEFVCEGLHRQGRLRRERLDHGMEYRA